MRPEPDKPCTLLRMGLFAFSNTLVGRCSPVSRNNIMSHFDIAMLVTAYLASGHSILRLPAAQATATEVFVDKFRLRGERRTRVLNTER